MPVETIRGVVMAGGASRRMGFDKRELRLEGQSLVERAASVLRAVCEEVVVSVQPDASWENCELRAIRDLRAHSGPLAGLESAIADAGRDGARLCSVFLLACDLPRVGVDLVRHVLEAAARCPDAAAVVPLFAGRRQPLCALYRGRASNAVKAQFESGDRSMAALLESIAVREVEIGPELPFFRSDLFHNLNRPSDLADIAASADAAR